MQPSRRMRMLASMVTAGNTLADIGTDHAYIPIFLRQEGVIASAIAMDVRKGPLQRAAAHIEEAGLSEYIETRLSAGLEMLACDEADTILIAGMGGPLMNRILAAKPEVAKQAKELILQPQSEIGETRAFLAQAGFEMQQEEILREDGKYYFMMRVTPGKPYALTPLQREFGPLLLKRREPELFEFLEREKRQCGEILEKLSSADNERTERRRAQIQARIGLIDEARRLF